MQRDFDRMEQNKNVPILITSLLLLPIMKCSQNHYCSNISIHGMKRSHHQMLYTKQLLIHFPIASPIRAVISAGRQSLISLLEQQFSKICPVGNAPLPSKAKVVLSPCLPLLPVIQQAAGPAWLEMGPLATSRYQKPPRKGGPRAIARFDSPLKLAMANNSLSLDSLINMDAQIGCMCMFISVG